ncbi:MAG: hypothetical protein LC745_12865, partial [Planctomycetia bacterium]|nr:hypothetical protein [Planctomycetia bacterium]
RFHESEAEFRKALSLRKALDGPAGRAAHVDTLYHLGALLAKLSKRDPEVTEAYTTAEAEMKALSTNDPANREYRQKRARYLNNIGTFLRHADPSKSRAVLSEALETQKALSDESPGVAGYRWAMARTQNNLGGSFEEAEPKDIPRAEGFYRTAIENFTKLATDFPSVPDYRSELAQALANLAYRKIAARNPALRDPRGALGDLARAVPLLESLVSEYTQRPDYRQKLAIALTRRGFAQAAARDVEAARASQRAAIDGLRRLVKEFPEVPEYESDLGLALRYLANLLGPQKAMAVADTSGLLREAIDHQRKAVAASGRAEMYREYLATDLNGLGIDLLGRKRYAEAAMAAAEVPDLVPGNMKRKVASAQILGRCLRSFETEGTPPEGPALTGRYQGLVLKILEEAVDRGLLRADDLDGEDFRALQG